jgi:hypothetical protein
MLLMQTTHGNSFSLDTWNSFVASRGDNRTAGVSFDEMRLWLCSTSNDGGTASGSKDIGAAKEKLEKSMKQESEDCFLQHKAAIVSYSYSPLFQYLIYLMLVVQLILAKLCPF